MHQDLVDKQEKLQPYLKEGFYSFIGPFDQSLLEPFIKAANIVASKISFTSTIHQVLSKKKVIQKTLEGFPNIPLRIYVFQVVDANFYFDDTMEGYCEKNNIDLKE